MRVILCNRQNNKRIAEKYGISDSCKAVRLYLTSTQKEELLNHVFFTDGKTFSKIVKSRYIYLVQPNDSVFDLFCSEEDPKVPLSAELFNDKRFIRIQVEDNYLIKFLSIITPIRAVD